MTVLREPLVVARYGKWTQLSLGLICMAAISSPQYVWTLLTRPLTEKLGVGLAELQVTFSGFYAGTAEISVTSVSAQQPVHPGQ